MHKITLIIDVFQRAYYLRLVLQLQFFKLMQYFPRSNFSKNPTRTRGRSIFFPVTPVSTHELDV